MYVIILWTEQLLVKFNARVLPDATSFLISKLWKEVALKFDPETFCPSRKTFFNKSEINKKIC